MARGSHAPIALLATCLAAVALAACGSDSNGKLTGGASTASTIGTAGSDTGNMAATAKSVSGEGRVIATVNGIAVTKEEVSAWMEALAGVDFFQVGRGRTLPAGLVSDPANYATCVTNLEAAIAKDVPGGAKPAAAVLLRKCRELHSAVKTQAVAYLMNAYWTIDLYRMDGVTATNAEVMALFRQIKARRFPSAQAQGRYLAQRRMTLAEELFEVKQDLLSEKIQRRLKQGGRAAFAKPPKTVKS